MFYFKIENAMFYLILNNFKKISNMSRGRYAPENGEKMKRAPNQYIIDLTSLKKYIKCKLPGEELNNVGALSKAAAKILSGNNSDLDQARKNLNTDTFMRDYNNAKKEIETKRAIKKEMNILRNEVGDLKIENNLPNNDLIIQRITEIEKNINDLHEKMDIIISILKANYIHEKMMK